MIPWLKSVQHNLELVITISPSRAQIYCSANFITHIYNLGHGKDPVHTSWETLTFNRWNWILAKWTLIIGIIVLWSIIRVVIFNIMGISPNTVGLTYCPMVKTSPSIIIAPLKGCAQSRIYCLHDVCRKQHNFKTAENHEQTLQG